MKDYIFDFKKVSKKSVFPRFLVSSGFVIHETGVAMELYELGFCPTLEQYAFV